VPSGATSRRSSRLISQTFFSLAADSALVEQLKDKNIHFYIDYLYKNI